ncbi:MAG TPA: AAA family ATPase [Candidatus Hydrogenedentes bacterium]|nr:AAA family ATPase [Candidatus Hydrogenedentota bacterium]
MKGFSFDSFVVHETNQTAYDICKKLADSDKDVPHTIVLLGESGSGKSHLLWAIVNQFREQNTKVGVALISSKDFPNKIKTLPDNPEKLKKKYPVILIVDELHLFEKDLADLERVMLAFQEHNQYVIVATNIHPSILPSLSGKLKAFLNNGTIVAIKPLPKSAGAPIPDAAVKQIAALKARVAQLEAAKGGAAAPEAQKEIDSLRKQLETMKHERDVARTALDRSEGELIDLREEVARLREGAPSDEQNVNAVVERLEKQKAALIERIASLEQQVEELIEFTHSVGEDAAGVRIEDLADEVTLATREEVDLLRVIDGIRDTLKHFEEGAATEAPDGETTETAQKTLATIAAQLQALGKRPAEAQQDESGEQGAEDVANEEESSEETT